MKQVVIIGAGPAGLTAAYKLLKESKDIEPVILEASQFVGGISRTHRFGENRMDLGGHRFFTKSREVMELWLELMPLAGQPAKDDRMLDRQVDICPGGPDPETSERVMLRRNRISRIFFLRKFFDYPISIKPRTFLNMGFLRSFDAGMGYLHSLLFKREEKSLEDFYINRFGKPLYKMFFEDYTQKVWGVHPSKISPDWGAQRVKGLSLSKALLNALTRPFRKGKAVETSLIESFYYPKRGPGSLYECLASEVEKLGGKIIRGAEVDRLTIHNGRITGLRANRGGEFLDFQPDAVFSSMPVKDLVAAMDPRAPQEIRSISDALPYRDFMTAGLLVRKLAVKNKSGISTVSNIIPDCWIYVQDRDVRLGRLQIFNNWSPYMVKDIENTVFIGLEYFCSEGDELWSMKDAEFVDMAAAELEKIGICNKSELIDSTVVRVKKAYPAYFGAYSKFDEVRRWLNEIQNLYCIGRNGQHRYNNMDHSMMTAIEAARIYISGGHDREKLWQINTEEEYHETKQA